MKNIILIYEGWYVETCYRYQAKLSAENAVIADWLIRLTTNQRNWGFGLCFLYLLNVKGFGWNHKRVDRIYQQLELNLRIKPKEATGWRTTCSTPLRKCRNSPPGGCGPIITSGPTWPSAASPRNRNWPWPLSLYLQARLKMGRLPLSNSAISKVAFKLIFIE